MVAQVFFVNARISVTLKLQAIKSWHRTLENAYLPSRRKLVSESFGKQQSKGQ
jgi:hypothetical protein